MDCKMSEKERELVEKNYKIVYKFLYGHNLMYDDIAQELIAHICSVIGMYDPSKSSFSTWVYSVCSNKLKGMRAFDMRPKRMPQAGLLCLNQPIRISGEDASDIELKDIIEDTCSYDLQSQIEDRIIIDSCISKYKDMFKKNGKEDMDIFTSVAFGDTFLDIAHRFGTSRQNIQQRYVRIRRRLKDIYDCYMLE